MSGLISKLKGTLYGDPPPQPSTAATPSTTLSPSGPAPPTAANMSSDLKPAGEAAAKVKPCCVCKDEKASRDECMLFSNADNPQEACQSTVDRYRSCMKGFGFTIA